MSRIGIIAGGGKLPLKLIDACKHDNKDYFVLALEGQADKKSFKNDPHKFVKLGAINESIKILKSENVDTIVMAGAVKRPGIFEIKLDKRAISIFSKLSNADIGDNKLLVAISEELEQEGFKIIGAHNIDANIITPEGLLTKTAPSDENKTDIEYGIKVVKQTGALDIGQAAIIQQNIVLGVEAIEGTDALIERCKKLKRKGGYGGVLVKGAKPQQDKRLDLPTIGMRTLENAHKSGLEGIAIEAGGSILLDRDEVIARADKLGMFILGFKTS